MAIEKYTTEAIVIESFDQGEHDRVYKLFTREFGLVMAHAKSIRKLESKLRAHMLPRSFVRATLVQGREVWRLVGAEGQGGEGAMLRDATHLLKRLVRGEGAHKKLYQRLSDCVARASSFDEHKGKLLLYYVTLVELGYADARVIGVKDIKEYASLSVDDLYTYLLLSYDQVRKHTQVVLKETQL